MNFWRHSACPEKALTGQIRRRDGQVISGAMPNRSVFPTPKPSVFSCNIAARESRILRLTLGREPKNTASRRSARREIRGRHPRNRSSARRSCG